VTLGVDAVRQAGAQEPTDRDAGARQTLDGQEHRLDRHHVVGVAVDQHDGRLRARLRRQLRGPDQGAGEAEHGGRGPGAARGGIECQHRALREADQRQAALVEPVAVQQHCDELV
jgi:hypothetical protein